MNIFEQIKYNLINESDGNITILFFLWRNSGPSNAWERSPLFKKLKKHLSQKGIRYRIVRYETSQETFKKYGVRGAPWTVYLKGGQKCQAVGGPLTIAEFNKWLSRC